MFRYRMSTMLWLFVPIALALGWCVDRHFLLQKMHGTHKPIEFHCQKSSLWSPAAFWDTGTAALERRLSNHNVDFAGNMVTSSQGLGDYQLRQPSIETLDAVIALLDDKSTRQPAAELLALYLEAVSGMQNNDEYSFQVKVHFHLHGLAKSRELMGDSDVGVRRAIALVLGNTFRSREAKEWLMDAYDKELDQGVKLYLSWSYQNVANVW